MITEDDDRLLEWWLDTWILELRLQCSHMIYSNPQHELTTETVVMSWMDDGNVGGIVKLALLSRYGMVFVDEVLEAIGRVPTPDQCRQIRLEITEYGVEAGKILAQKMANIA